jgi:uncharacterized membrane protein
MHYTLSVELGLLVLVMVVVLIDMIVHRERRPERDTAITTTQKIIVDLRNRH